MNYLDLIVRISIFVVGAYVVFTALLSAIRTFLLPRAAPDPVTRVVFSGLRRVFDLWLTSMRTYEERDRAMAYYGPVAILFLLAAWLCLVLTGYTLTFWSMQVQVLARELRRRAAGAGKVDDGPARPVVVAGDAAAETSAAVWARELSHPLNSHKMISGGHRKRTLGAPLPSMPIPRVTYSVIPPTCRRPASNALP